MQSKSSMHGVGLVLRNRAKLVQGALRSPYTELALS